MKSILTVLAKTLLIANLMIGISVQAQEPEPAGEEFQINTYATGAQREAALAADTEGNFVVVWDSDGSDGTDTHGRSIQGQLYDASGTPVGGQFQVNSYTLNNQQRPAVAVEPQGGFVVVWESIGSYGSDTEFNYSIQAQRYDSSGTPVGGQFQVNSYTTGTQGYPAVAVEPQGNFVVVWDSEGSSGSDTNANDSVQAQRYDSSGAPVGGEFQVNSYTTFHQNRPSVAVEAQGNFVVVWNSWGSYGTDTSLYSIQAQRYDASGTPLGGEFQVNSYTTSRQSGAAVAVEPQGNFVVVWQSYGSGGTDTSYASIQAQRFNASGVLIGGQFQVNAYTTNRQNSPAVAVEPQGNFVVVWQSYGSGGTDTSGYSTHAQRHDASGTPLGGEFQVNAYTPNWQIRPAVAAGAPSNFMVVWDSDGSDGTDNDASSIQGQRYSSGAVIFSDDFESGDTSSWSSTVP